MNFDVEKYKIFECITGSRLYGLANELSDYDYRGVAIPPMEILLHPFQGFEQKDSGFEEDDKVIYSLNKFLQLCANANPNIIELLFIPESNIIFSTKKWKKIVENRHLFLSKKVKHTFTGFAFSQLKRIERHRGWLLNPVEKPNREDFGLPIMPQFSFEKLQNIIHAPKNTIVPEWREYAHMEMLYRNQKDEWDKYNNWKKTRNPERFKLEEKFGYDTKHASHLFRSMTEGKELLLTEKITFPLPNAEEILEIKNGKYDYYAVIEMAKSMEQEFEQWYEQSSLPMTPNKAGLAELYFELIEK